MDREHRVWTGPSVIPSHPKVGSHSPSNTHAEPHQRPPDRQAARPSPARRGRPSANDPRRLLVVRTAHLRAADLGENGRSHRMPAPSKPRERGSRAASTSRCECSSCRPGAGRPRCPIAGAKCSAMGRPSVLELHIGSTWNRWASSARALELRDDRPRRFLVRSRDIELPSWPLAKRRLRCETIPCSNSADASSLRGARASASSLGFIFQPYLVFASATSVALTPT